jgi:homoserine O-acetyltransferase/O-succinyltransferase
LLAINSADDERNPAESGIMERELKRVKNGKLYLIPASDQTRGHGTTGMAKFYTAQLRTFLAAAPSRGM